LGDVRRNRRSHDERWFNRSTWNTLAVVLSQVVGVLDQLRHGGVRAQVIVVIANAGDCAVQLLQVFIVKLCIRNRDVTGGLIDDQAPQALQEALRTDDILGCPWTRRVQRTHRHLVNTQGIRAEFLAEIIRANRVLQRLTHLAVFLIDLFTIVEELSVLLLYLSCWYIDAAGISVGKRLDVALVVQATVWLLGSDMPQVKEHLVPETGVQQVQHGVLHTANIEVNTTWIIRAVDIWLRTSPVTFIFNIYYGLIIDRVNVAQLVEGRTCPLRHDVGITVVGLGALTQVEFNLDPLLRLRQRWLWLGISIIGIERHRLVVLDL